nr:MAG TPA: hypothetical protein [Caudoviricetes sp.]
MLKICINRTNHFRQMAKLVMVFVWFLFGYFENLYKPNKPFSSNGKIGHGFCLYECKKHSLKVNYNKKY